MGNTTTSYNGHIERDFRENPIHESHHVPEMHSIAVEEILARVPELARKECASLINQAVRSMIGALRYADKPKLIAVTQLTSTDEETMHNELLIDKPLDEVVRQYALNAKEAGLDGVVCSAHEAADIHLACGADFLTVTPGIRLQGDSAGDQKRVMTPADARDQGSDYIVVGRSITKEAKPYNAYMKCREEFML